MLTALQEMPRGISAGFWNTFSAVRLRSGAAE
jgi:hypothetical protein